MAKRISAYCIKKGMEEIDEEEYMESLSSVLHKALLKYDDLPQVIRMDKSIRYTSSRGYEPTLIFKVVKEIEENS